MYDLNDTIAAVSSPACISSAPCKTIIRISGADTYSILKDIAELDNNIDKRGITSAAISLEGGFKIQATVYAFYAPASYTGENLAEIHFFAAAPLAETLFQNILKNSRLAGPGEFTLRAYLNGKIDLSQAEAVAQIVSSSNKTQLAAAEKLLAGKLCLTITDIRKKILEILSLIEAALDFSQEDIDIIDPQTAFSRINQIEKQLRAILTGSIRYEALIDIPSVGLAGAANAGKSSLINALLGKSRSIISEQHGTTRDVLTDILQLENCRTAVFDCAGIETNINPSGILDKLSRQAALEALNAADLILFCADISKKDFSDDLTILKTINPKEMMLVLTKPDLLNHRDITIKKTEIEQLFNQPAVTMSTTDPASVDMLKTQIDQRLATLAPALQFADKIAVNERHRNVVASAIENVKRAASEIKIQNEEISAMYLRSAYENLANLEREDINEEILDRIFSSFCIGK